MTIERTVTRVVCSAAIAVMAVVASDARPAAQYASRFPSYRRPLSPIFPETMAACDALATQWNQLCSEISKAHSECLANTKANDPNPGGTCSKAACQPLHGACGEFGDESSRAVDTCRAEVREKQRQRESSVADKTTKPADRSRDEERVSGAPVRPGGDQRQARPHQRPQRPEIRGELGPRETSGRADVPRPEPADGAEIAQAVIERAIDDGINRLEENIAYVQDRVTGRNSREYVRGARDTRAVLRGMKHMIATAEYSYLVGQLIAARDSDSRTRAGAQIGLQVFTDIASKGLEVAVEKAFGKRVVAILAGPVGWVAVETLTPTPTNADFSEIIRDTSGRTTLEHRQYALFRLWHSYDEFGSRWHIGQKRELLDVTDIVYRLK